MITNTSDHKHQAILFDFDGVLVDSEPIHYQCWKELLSPYGIELDWESYVATCVGVAERAMLERLVAFTNTPVAVDELFGLYPAKKKRFLDLMQAALPFAPGIGEFLKQLQEYQLAVVSSSARSEVEPFLELAGIRHYFGAIVCGSEAGPLKPSPEPYLRAARLLSIQSALVVEDSDTGEASGRAAGFEVLRVTHPMNMESALTERLGIGSDSVIADFR